MRIERTVKFTQERLEKTGRKRRRPIGATAIETTDETVKVARELEGRLVLEVDVEAIAEWLGRRALVARSGKARMLGGLVRARIVGRTVRNTKTETPSPLRPGEAYVEDAP